MKTVSTAYKSQINKMPFRNPLYARIVVQQIDMTALGDGTFSDSGHVSYSDWSKTDTLYIPEETYATLETNFWRLDGSFPIKPDNAPYHSEGFVSDKISGANGNYTTNPLITRQFTDLKDFVGLTIVFDGVNDEYPEHIIVRCYNGATQVDTEEVTNITSSTVEINRPFAPLDKFTIEVVKSTLPNRRVRIQRMLYGIERIFENTTISSVKTTTDIDPINRRLPTETLSFTVFDYDRNYDPDNPDGIWEYIDIQSPVSIQFGYRLDGGQVEWLPPDKYLLDGRPEVSNNQANFKATKVVGYMTDIYFKGTFGIKNLYDLAEEVLEDAELSALVNPILPWVIDESLKDIYTNAPLPIDTHKNCLQLIANAGMCKFYTDHNGTIRLEKFEIPETPTDFTIDLGLTYDEPVISKIEPLYSVNVLKYTYKAETTAKELHKSTFEVSGTTDFYAEFSTATDVNVNITGGTLSNVQTYANAATATITANGEVTVTITGKEVTHTTSGIPYVVGTRNQGETEVIENPLVTSDSHKRTLEQHLADYLTLRNAYTVNYRGNPELEAGDFINLQSPFTELFSALVLKHELSFDGGALRGSGIFKRVGDE
jgi:hypothetical protein